MIRLGMISSAPAAKNTRKCHVWAWSMRNGSEHFPKNILVFAFAFSTSGTQQQIHFLFIHFCSFFLHKNRKCANGIACRSHISRFQFGLFSTLFIASNLGKIFLLAQMMMWADAKKNKKEGNDSVSCTIFIWRKLMSVWHLQNHVFTPFL
jgi:hypothetical protein